MCICISICCREQGKVRREIFASVRHVQYECVIVSLWYIFFTSSVGLSSSVTTFLWKGKPYIYIYITDKEEHVVCAGCASCYGRAVCTHLHWREA
ncbi:hypothetical protein TRSC58_07291 [Trypanosoma rangeli SC58]|uniref:Uncharacterized protein n=1 Tax=Trypanosoma rangeli SC58 TaxID=429131 RepID=A0A061IS49_TRYRA|nr:hypothetical protein TRSC58_07291 [Trypanosoma rangeli SC58]